MLRFNLIKPVGSEYLRDSLTPLERRLIRATYDLARFIRKGNFTDIILSGQSGPRIALPLFKIAWRYVAPGAPLPKIHIFDQEGNRLLYQNLEDQTQRTRLLGEYINAKLPGLLAVRQGKVCFVEDMIITGEKYFAIRRILNESRFSDFGFTSLRFAFLCGSSRYLDPKILLQIQMVT